MNEIVNVSRRNFLHTGLLAGGQHINLQGRFEFLKTPDALNIDAVIRALTTPQKGRVVNLFA
jgi:hypothetical protein